MPFSEPRTKSFIWSPLSHPLHWWSGNGLRVHRKPGRQCPWQNCGALQTGNESHLFSQLNLHWSFCELKEIMQTWKLNKALFSMTSGSLVLSNQQVTEMELEIPGFWVGKPWAQGSTSQVPMTGCHKRKRIKVKESNTAAPTTDSTPPYLLCSWR
jgi:hypothetical protein